MTIQSKKIKSFLREKASSLCEKLENSVIAHSALKGSVIFGPVPSRRLGFSLGINTIKCKVCTYDCIYCQVGRTNCCSTCSDTFLTQYELFCFVKKKLEKLEKEGVKIDYLSFVPSGEPTVDSNLGKKILLLREFGYKIAVFTNASLLWKSSVKENLMFTDYVSVKIDTVTDDTWRKINRPHTRLRLNTILNGISDFSKIYKGKLTTETMLVKNFNDNIEEIEQVINFIKTIKRSNSYFTIPTRPPAEEFQALPDGQTLTKLSQYIKENIPDSEALFFPESNDFKAAGKTEDEILGITRIHPMREESIKKLIREMGANDETLNNMINKGLLLKRIYQNKIFYSAKVKQE